MPASSRCVSTLPSREWSVCLRRVSPVDLTNASRGLWPNKRACEAPLSRSVCLPANSTTPIRFFLQEGGFANTRTGARRRTVISSSCHLSLPLLLLSLSQSWTWARPTVTVCWRDFLLNLYMPQAVGLNGHSRHRCGIRE